jgi:hypothetical protein
MSKIIAKTPAGIAIRDGIGARLIGLGFKGKSERFYLKDTMTYPNACIFVLMAGRVHGVLRRV